MANLMGTMSIALGALKNNQEALDVTSNNIANQNTPGYSRQRVNLSESTYLQVGQLQFGTGAQVDNIQSIRDQVLDFRLNSEMSTQSGLDSYLQPMQQIQSYFNEASGTGLQSSISGFYNSLTQLSTNPSSVPLRQSVISSAQTLAQTFNNSANNLNNIKAAMDAQVPSLTQQANTLTQSIAALNLKISQASGSGQQSGVLEDQRNQLIQKLSQIIEVQTIDGGHGSVSLSTSGGAALVVGAQSFALQSVQDPTTGLNDVQTADGRNITSSISGGQLGGILRVRDQGIPTLLSQLDTLASGIATAVNTQHQAGTDLNGNPGQALFNVPATAPGTASVITVNITDPRLIAAGTSTDAGDNSNILKIAAQQSQTIVNGQSPVDYYSNTVAQLGTNVQQAIIQQSSQDVVVQQLQAQVNSVSGVSLDEEAANLVKFQSAYQAAARVVNVVDQMTQTVLSMGAS